MNSPSSQLPLPARAAFHALIVGRPLPIRCTIAAPQALPETTGLVLHDLPPSPGDRIVTVVGAAWAGG